MNVWATADQHFDHANILKYTDRHKIWNDVDEMDEGLIKRWNEKVRPGDEVYHLGDFCLGDVKRADYYFSRLNGIIHILCLPWHHDKNWLKYFNLAESRDGVGIIRLPPVYVIESYRDYPPIFLNHYAQFIWDRSHYGSWHLFAHSHGRFEGWGLSHDVGVDANNYYPISLEEVALVMKTKTIAQHDRIKREEI